ncbi:MAG: phage integrase N-terminal SAM-like domain-containing protein, partial [Bacteroidota bacterium]
MFHLVNQGFPYFDPPPQKEKVYLPINDALKIIRQLKCQGYRHKTNQDYSSNLKRFEDYIRALGMGDLDIESFQLKQARAYMDHLHINCKLSATTWNNYLRRQKAFFAVLVDREYIKTNPFSKITKRQQTQKTRRCFNDMEKQTVFSHLQGLENPYLSLAVLLIYYCALRPGEIRQLRRSAFDLRAGLIRVGGAIAKNKKTAVITMPDQLQDYLKTHPVATVDDLCYVFGEKLKPHQRRMIGKNALNRMHRE